ncbi:MAG: DUF4170 domain-containing protein [Devosiaceae bacterium]|nr:DUF4170 domain-containing protein [Devosiaceae bacterium]
MSEKKEDKTQKQLLHMVIGGELSDLEEIEFSNLDEVDIVGVYPNYASAYDVWKTKAQQSVDNAHMRYFVVHLHRLMDPEHDEE